MNVRCAMLLLLALGLGMPVVPLRAGEPALKPGLKGEYFKLDAEISDFPDLSKLKPHATKVDARVNFESTDGEFNGTGLVDRFAVRWTGTLRLAKASAVRFYTESDDGSRLFINGKQVVDNGGIHPMEEKEGDIELPAGDHEIRIEYFDNGAGAGCKVSWELRGQPREGLPANVLFHTPFTAENPPAKP